MAATASAKPTLRSPDASVTTGSTLRSSCTNRYISASAMRCTNRCPFPYWMMALSPRVTALLGSV
eukprot:7978214-Pyramimonas_sp.AAC.1